MTGFDGSNYNVSYLYRTDEKGNLLPTGNALQDRERLIRTGLGEMMKGGVRSQ